jgi:hypothetical protein
VTFVVGSHVIHKDHDVSEVIKVQGKFAKVRFDNWGSYYNGSELKPVADPEPATLTR